MLEKKKNTIEFEKIISQKTRKIVRIAKLLSGLVHGFKTRKISDPTLISTTVLADSAYVGMKNIHKKTILSKKRKRGKALGSEAQEQNRECGTKSIKVEHTFEMFKNRKIFNRNHLRKMELRFNIITDSIMRFLPKGFNIVKYNIFF